MKKRYYILIAIVIALLINTKLVIQRDYQHYVVASRIGDISLVFNDFKLSCIWIGDTLYSEASEEEYDNL